MKDRPADKLQEKTNILLINILACPPISIESTQKEETRQKMNKLI